MAKLRTHLVTFVAVAALPAAGCDAGPRPPASFPLSPCDSVASGTARLYGTVAEWEDGDPVDHGQIALEPAGCRVLSDSAGRWGFTDLPAGRYTVQFRLLGYDSLSRTVEVGPDEAERVHFRPAIRPVMLYRFPPTTGETRGTGPPEPAGGCTADNPPARLDVYELLADDDLADFRQRTGLAGASPEDAEVLRDPEDSSTCARLRELVPEDYRTEGERTIWRFTYFRVGERYVITMEMDIETGERPPVMTRQATIVANRDLEVVGTLMN